MIDVARIDKDAIYTTGETAELLGYSRRTVLRLALSGGIPYFLHPLNGRKAFKGKDLLKVAKGSYK